MCSSGKPDLPDSFPGSGSSIQWHLQKCNVVCCRERHTRPQMTLGRLWPCGFSASGLSSPWGWFRHPLGSAQAAGSVPLSALCQALLLRNTRTGAPSSATELLRAHPWPRASRSAGQVPRPSLTQPWRESTGGLCFCRHQD